MNCYFVFRWTFNLYDLNGDGVITKDEMEDIVASVSNYNSYIDTHMSTSAVDPEGN